MIRALKGYKVVDTSEENVRCECEFCNIMTGETFTKILNVSPAQIGAWAQGESIQNAMPQLSVYERELFLTGMEW